MKGISVVLLLPLFRLAEGLTLDLDEEAGSGSGFNPAARVVKLLKEMNKRLDEEQREDEKTKSKIECWCKTNQNGKNDAIAANKAKIQQLTTKIEELNARVAILEPKIRRRKQDLAKAANAIKTADAIRAQQKKSFEDDEAELFKSINGVKNAKVVLSRGSFLQLSDYKLNIMGKMVRAVLDLQAPRLVKVLDRADRMLLESFTKNPRTTLQGDSFLQTTAPKDTLIGILVAIADDFAAELQKEIEEDKENQKNYQELVKAKMAEIKSLKVDIQVKQKEKSDAKRQLASSKRSKTLAQKTLEEDEKFVAVVNEKCRGGTKDFDDRTATRQMEVQAVNKALEILDSDESRSLFTKSLSFLQTSDNAEAREKAAAMLSSEGKRLRSQSLAALSTTTKRGTINQLKIQIMKMVGELKKQQADEVEEHDTCKGNLNKNALLVQEKTQSKSAAQNTLEELQTDLREVEGNIKEVSKEIKDLQQQMAVATEERKRESKQFQADVEEQKAAQQVIEKAAQVLREFYGTLPGQPGFVQIEAQSGLEDASSTFGYEAMRDADMSVATGDDDEKPVVGGPADFKEYKKNGGGVAVVEVLLNLAKDAEEMQVKAKKSENDSEDRYENFASQTKDADFKKNAELDNYEKQKAGIMEDMNEARNNRDAAQKELGELGESKLELHKDCDFLMINFETRQKARTEEMDALVQAKGILSGATV
eukprot:TRINITY_DN64958_c0_g1_i1.p1 TRINITY_DN64958_c0_g1~~TRINITY_DN64958_c0_g1_i1.p1  ORF type:complete len:707 (+),score=205.76 TRINITY_DN64958_c0_g1_i1:132-2252(+)